MKFLRFLTSPHRLIAILLGVSFLVFTQLVVFKPYEVSSVREEPVSSVKTITQIQDENQEKIVNVDVLKKDAFDTDELYYDDLLIALNELNDDVADFSGLNDLDVPIVKRDVANPKIAIVIDDLGMNRVQSWNTVNLNFPVTLAFLPYAPDIQKMADLGGEKGHDIILHVPMQPLDKTINAGEDVLSVGDSEVLLKKALDKNFGGLSSYVGINNHMGSAFTADEKGMNIVMSYLKEKGVFFFDSRTTADSVAEKMAERHGVPLLVRDVFLDHEETYDFAENALSKLERIAFEKGFAIAIGHPKEITLMALNDWVQGAKSRGVEFVTLSDLIAR